MYNKTIFMQMTLQMVIKSISKSLSKFHYLNYRLESHLYKNPLSIPFSIFNSLSIYCLYFREPIHVCYIFGYRETENRR
jgi:hypothetical protein